MSDPAFRPTPSPAEAALGELEANLPPICWTADPRPWAVIDISAKTVQNSIAEGRGPSPTLRLGRRTGFGRVDIIRWLRGRLTVDGGPAQAQVLERQRPTPGGVA